MYFTLSCVIGVTLGCNKAVESEHTFSKESTYVGSASCKSCHESAYQDWQKSDHFLAMQPANDSTVLGDFNNTSYTADGVTNTFFKKDGKFFINTQGDDGLQHDYEVLYVFGHFPLQQYLIAFPGGRMQSTRVSWDSRDKQWFHQYAGRVVHHDDWLHWTGNSQNWNTMCASCHSTDLQKNYDEQADTYNTTWKEINVSCESCHGPGSSHIAYINSGQYQKGNRVENAGLFYGRDTISQLQLNTCAACHARKSDVAPDLLRSDEIMDDLIPQVLTNELYFADGQIMEEDYEYGSFTQSKMFHQNVRCTSCHNPHSGKLRLTGNNLCLSCHKAEYSTPAHHFHPAGTPGAQCVNCHMVTRTYMGVDHRRDHSFRIPRPDQSLKYGTPNACTDCHDHQTAKWAAERIVEWYGPERKYHFSDDLIPGSLLNDQSETHLVKLLGDSTQPEIARATAAYYLGNIQTMTAVGSLLEALQDKKALVRYHVLRSLENFPPDHWRNRAHVSLTDKVRAVRIAAADLYHRLPGDALPPDAKEAYLKADAENLTFLQYQTDFSVGNVMMADYEMQGNDHPEAIRYYQRALKMDSLMNYARMNLAATYNAVGQNEEALKTLLEAAAIDAFNDHIFYSLGLLQYEMGMLPAAMENFQKAVNLGSFNPGVYYNFGIALQLQGKLKEAEQIMLKGIALNPGAANLHYELAYFYMQQNQPERAMQYATTLKGLEPGNPEYQELFRSLGI
jgi:predicted CXXCH cytochrome family protein